MKLNWGSSLETVAGEPVTLIGKAYIQNCLTYVCVYGRDQRNQNILMVDNEGFLNTKRVIVNLRRGDDNTSPPRKISLAA